MAEIEKRVSTPIIRGINGAELADLILKYWIINIGLITRRLLVQILPPQP